MGFFMGGTTFLKPTDQDEAAASDSSINTNGSSMHESGPESTIDYGGTQTGKKSKNKRQHSPVKEGSHNKRVIRVKGGVPATARKITEPPDEIDQRIIDLKLLGYSDERVAQQLKQEDLIRYDSRSINSRWTKLRKILEKQEQERLDDDLSDWHVGEDEVLTNSVKIAEAKYLRDLGKLQERKWMDVALLVTEKLQKKKYTASACRDRFEGIRDGTALLPIELDDDQAGRRRMRDERITAAKAARAAEKQRLNIIAERKKARATANKKAFKEANQKRIVFHQKREADRLELARIRNERHNYKTRAQAIKNATFAQLRAEREWKIKQNRVEKEIYKQLTGRYLDGRASRTGVRTGTRRVKEDFIISDEEDEIIDEFESDEVENEVADTETDSSDVAGFSECLEEDGGLAVASSSKVTTALRTVRPVANPHSAMSARQVTGSSSTLQKTPRAKSALTMPGSLDVLVTADTLANARSILTLEELTMLCVERDLPVPDTASEQHHHIVARLAADDDQLTNDRLNAMLRSRSVKTSGPRSARVRRLQDADAAVSQRGREGIKSTQLGFMRHYIGYQGEFRELLTLAENNDSRGEGGQVTSIPTVSSSNLAQAYQAMDTGAGNDSESDEIMVSHVIRR